MEGRFDLILEIIWVEFAYVTRLEKKEGISRG